MSAKALETEIEKNGSDISPHRNSDKPMQAIQWGKTLPATSEFLDSISSSVEHPGEMWWRKEWVDRERRGPPELLFTGRNETTETVISPLHFVIVWNCTGRTGPFTCNSQVAHSLALPQ
ncbi:hypothetical protein EVAR_79248_1 [Eumeta japonica]|uniref:Uncharacterized protein n=1 Tax=Eumeta variegata TaxID=151549 RepID=A0A4C1TEG7_EUMVA|nr:hypothetical protein EVAR_79248_1 [Eumeta japonica]